MLRRLTNRQSIIILLIMLLMLTVTVMIIVHHKFWHIASTACPICLSSTAHPRTQGCLYKLHRQCPGWYTLELFKVIILDVIRSYLTTSSWSSNYVTCAVCRNNVVFKMCSWAHMYWICSAWNVSKPATLWIHYGGNRCWLIRTQCTLCLKKNQTLVIFSNISDKSLPILIIFGTENRQ